MFEEPQEGTMDVQSPVDVLFLWACSVLVFMMQAGFAMVRTCRRSCARWYILSTALSSRSCSSVVRRIDKSQEREEHLAEKHH